MKIFQLLLSFLIMQFCLSAFLPGKSLDMPVPDSKLLGFNCTESSGTIDSFSIESTILHRTVDYKVYTPPCYDPAGSVRYPVLYLLHGSSSSNDQWIRLGLQTSMDAMIRAEKIVPFIIVLPKEQAYLEDTRTSKYGSVILEELIPQINKNWKVQTDPAHTAIGGLSRGAGWAIHLGLAHPETFGHVGAHSLALFYADINQIEKWRRLTEEESLPRLYLDIGMQDYLKDSAKKFEIKLSEYSYPHEWHLKAGTHDDAYWTANLPTYLRWYSLGWEE